MFISRSSIGLLCIDAFSRCDVYGARALEYLSRASRSDTQAWQSDGFGSQFQNIISSALFAMFENKTFCMTPIGSIDMATKMSFYQDIENLLEPARIASNQTVEQYTEKKTWVDHQLSEGNASRVHEGIRTIRQQFLRNKRRVTTERCRCSHCILRNSVDQNSVDRAER